MTRIKLIHGADASPQHLPDIETLLDDLDDAQAGAPGELTAGTLLACDHLAIATDNITGKAVAVLGASGGMAAAGPFVQITAAAAQDGRAAEALMARLLAMTLLRVAGLQDTPRLVATRLAQPALLAAFRRLAAALPASGLFPVAPSAPVCLAAARTACDIARTVAPGCRLDLATGRLGTGRGVWLDLDPLPASGVRHGGAAHALRAVALPDRRALHVLDMTAACETAIIDQARRLYRRR